MSTPTRTIGGVRVPDTPLITAALAFARAHSTPPTYNHVQRSWLLGALIAAKHPALHSIDTEVHAVAALLHDLGWELNGPLCSPDKRFEVDSANAARAFLHREAPGWDARRVQLVWDAIALHTTNGIARYKEPEVVATLYGIAADFRGPEAEMLGGLLTWEEYRGVVGALPRLGLMEELKEVHCGLCRMKPETTYDNYVGEFGERYVEGYSREGKGTLDAFERIKLDD